MASCPLSCSRMMAARSFMGKNQLVHPRRPALLKQGKSSTQRETATKLLQPGPSPTRPPKSTYCGAPFFPPVHSLHPRRPFRSSAFVWPPPRRSIYFPFPSTAGMCRGRGRVCPMHVTDHPSKLQPSIHPSTYASFGDHRWWWLSRRSFVLLHIPIHGPLWLTRAFRMILFLFLARIDCGVRVKCDLDSPPHPAFLARRGGKK